MVRGNGWAERSRCNGLNRTGVSEGLDEFYVLVASVNAI